MINVNIDIKRAERTDCKRLLADLDLEPLHKLPEYTNLLLKYKVPVPDY